MGLSPAWGTRLGNGPAWPRVGVVLNFLQKTIPRTDLDSPHRLENEADRESEFESTFLQTRP